MRDLFGTLRLAAYVFAIPLVISAAVSAQLAINNQQELLDSSSATVTGENQDASASVAATPEPAKVPVEVPADYSYVLQIDEAGGVSGRVANYDETNGSIAASGVRVTLNRGGRTVASALTDDAGVYRFDSVQPGSYTFIASSQSSLAAMGVYVVNASQAIGANDVQLQVQAVSHESLEPIRSIMNREIQTEQLDYLVDAEKDELPVVYGNNRVQLGENGTLQGRLSPLDWMGPNASYDLSGTRVEIYSGSTPVGSADVSADGSYEISGLDPGVYSLVAWGPYGNAALCLELTDGAFASTDSPVSLASSSPSQGGSADVVLTEPVSGEPYDVVIDTPTEPLGVGPVPTPGFGPGGFAGAPSGGFGGGGFGGGFGGMDIGGLIGDALAFALVYKLIDEVDFDDDDDFIQQPTVVPPVVIPPVVPPASPADP